MNVVTCTLTEAGAALAHRLPYEHRHGALATTVRARWASVDGLVLVCAAGIAARVIAPLLDTKTGDPAVVVVDDAGRWAIPLAGGHRGGANDLARHVAGLIGAEAVVTTATDASGVAALDTLPGYRADGDVAGVTRRWLDGHPPAVVADPALGAWPLPPSLPRAGDGGAGPHRVTVTDADRPAGPLEVLLRPGSLVVGVGASSGADPSGLGDLLSDALVAAGLHPAAVAALATLDRKLDEPAIVALGGALGVAPRGLPAEALAPITVPSPSTVVAAAVGTPSVAEAAALLVAGPGAELVVPKQRSADATVAVARRRAPEGHLAVVGLGPGDPRLRTPQAVAAICHAETVIGFGPYVDLAADLLGPHHRVMRYPIGEETERGVEALRRAAAGEQVALVCSGDAGIYAMASLVCELAPGHGDPPLTVVPGITAALAGAAVLGAPLGHDHAAISLSDLLTPWAMIERRVRAAAEADFVVSLYNPRSKRRTLPLDRALDVLRAHRPADTPAAIVTDVGRPGGHVARTTVAELDAAQVGMTSLVIVGASTTRWLGPRMVTPRGYAFGRGKPDTERDPTAQTS